MVLCNLSDANIGSVSWDADKCQNSSCGHHNVRLTVGNVGPWSRTEGSTVPKSNNIYTLFMPTLESEVLRPFC